MPETKLLEVRNLDAFYGAFQALFGISLYAARGETLAIIGANSAGKSTLMKAIVGLVTTRNAEICFGGGELAGRPTQQIVRQGIALVPEGRRLFRSLSVEENLLVGGHLHRPGPWSLAAIYDLFPVLGEKRHQPSTSLSGGQQQMVAIGRALMANPDLVLIDELSLGLAPIVIRDIYAALPRVTAAGTSAIIVEQDTSQALAVANRVYCLRGGRITLEGTPASLTRDAISAAYFGV
ncbi:MULTISPECIES: ABC transporter ATP-binding protein [unclassified Beijerinckia]|uniref:ABC transporter ATP-binding protein n=1 Tax=unclassified Beijerinckia TaxID=2638183 RepID=UPI00089D6FD8|nr:MULTISPECIES: ABC transporter ATP-binding protein [unclassified Beijerinckia]MDH7794346.1 branched-chain amino acid transport system ATP-binding protein [Beijerinckia sp. GAS462]SEB59520.1 amino acid/amide ABC transporter ATP-binding protein 2, HAAT family [Beijerinckia sp. 28-YEA-48]